VREALLREYEIDEISLFADKVFRYGESESAVLIGRRLGRRQAQPPCIRYQRIRERQIERFSRTYEPGTTEKVEPTRFVHAGSSSLFLPDLHPVWDALSSLPSLDGFAHVAKGLEHKSDNDPTLPPHAVKESVVAMEGIRLDPGFAGWSERQMTHGLPPVVWLNLDPITIQEPRSGTVTGIPQVLLNYARVSREAWRLKALLDHQGHPVTSDFLVVRPTVPRVRLEVLWGICNSPIGNAYAYCHSSKRHVLAGTMRRMPVPDLASADLKPLEQAVVAYLDAARSVPVERQPEKQRRQEDSRQRLLFGDTAHRESPTNDALREQLKALHWRIDAEVLRLYSLPAELEREVLDLFAGIRRRGVPFEQMEYFPKGFTDLDRLSDLLAITADWPKTNRRRAKLIDLEEEGHLKPAEAEELERLQRLADASVSLLRPVQMAEADRIIENLKRRGLWEE
jgi:hypothetical protein